MTVKAKAPLCNYNILIHSLANNIVLHLPLQK